MSDSFCHRWHRYMYKERYRISGTIIMEEVEMIIIYSACQCSRGVKHIEKYPLTPLYCLWTDYSNVRYWISWREWLVCLWLCLHLWHLFFYIYIAITVFPIASSMKGQLPKVSKITFMNTSFSLSLSQLLTCM